MKNDVMICDLNQNTELWNLMNDLARRDGHHSLKTWANEQNGWNKTALEVVTHFVLLAQNAEKEEAR